MTYKIPFKDAADEIKPLISGIDKSLELDNISSSIKKAKNDIIDVFGEDIWKIMIDHYNSDDYNVENQDNENLNRLDELVKKIQDPLIHFGLYRHFIWLILRVSNTGVTVTKTDDETTAYKYLTDEAKSDLISTAWEGINNLIVFLNKEATKFTEWTKETLYTVGKVVVNDSSYYKCVIEHTSSEDFATNAANWTAQEKTDIIFYQWTESIQYIETKSLIFDDYKDFEKYFGIDKSAFFLIKARYIIDEIINDYIIPRISTFDTLKKELQFNNVSAANVETFKKIKRFLAYKTVAIACFRFDYHEIPRSIRFEVDHELKRSDKDKNPTFIKEKISKNIESKADEYLVKLEMHLDTQKRIAEPDDVETTTEIIDVNVTEILETDKHMFLG